MEPAGGEGRDTSGVEHATHSAGCGQRQAAWLQLLVLRASAVAVWPVPVPPIVRVPCWAPQPNPESRCDARLGNSPSSEVGSLSTL